MDRPQAGGYNIYEIALNVSSASSCSPQLSHRRGCPHCLAAARASLPAGEIEVSQASSCFLSRWERTKVRVSSSLYTGVRK